MESIVSCIKCGNEIPPLRLKALPGTKTCIGCSGVSRKKGRNLIMGEGDHSYVELEILEEDAYNKITALEQSRGRKTSKPIEIPSSEEDDVTDIVLKLNKASKESKDGDITEEDLGSFEFLE